MNKTARVALLWGLAALPSLAMADIILHGKLQSYVSAFVRPSHKLLVTDDKGGWFDQGLEMIQLGGWNTPYDVRARLRVVSSSGVFRVRLDEPLSIRNNDTATQVFQQPKVDLAAEGSAPKTLSVGQGTAFENPPGPAPDQDTTGYYNLTVSAYPPEGNFKETAGTYSGVLSLTFEPVITDP